MTVYFISGHRKISSGEFIEYYAYDLIKAVKEYPFCKFVVGDYYGIDKMAQTLFKDLRDKVGAEINLTVYHMFEKPRNNVGDWPTIGGFKTDEERDAAMTAISDEDIAWVNPKFLGKNSGTEQNIMRRIIKESKND